ncbi:hypothetical protein SLNWT_2222 [Streptomyces albus]|uniref:Uncharacterized protein n=1 Tax=Streptomyces albus (strain ATCC 21838 / DSM 41398 / FERM P-419 / JCM 4703 / NBRC 107858) TaxID=1081613 RepID=A0A0B5EJX5_STRA4|nr:hypothetical protein SLNWT_2222 [Streptomyces albus]AOU76912.1 hypothetical protein SLNHY_2221 [Streptomyces albus]AYN32690.1 hypothetical protein DUI70_2187 [Streptomyces albus]
MFQPDEALAPGRGECRWSVGALSGTCRTASSGTVDRSLRSGGRDPRGRPPPGAGAGALPDAAGPGRAPGPLRRAGCAGECPAAPVPSPRRACGVPAPEPGPACSADPVAAARSAAPPVAPGYGPGGRAPGRPGARQNGGGRTPGQTRVDPKGAGRGGS